MKNCASTLQISPSALRHVENFDYIFCDIWGVINIGGSPVDGAIEFLLQMELMKKKVLFISNASVPKSAVSDLLQKIGVPHISQNILSSGEFFYQTMNSNTATKSMMKIREAILNIGRKCFVIGNHINLKMISDLDLVSTNANAADWVAVFDIENCSNNMIDLDEQLDICRIRKLPVVCLNSDKATMNKVEKLIGCKMIYPYNKMHVNKNVFLFGKPNSGIYEFAVDTFNVVDKAKVIAIGDSIESDIRGAVSFGIASILVLTGSCSGKNIMAQHEVAQIKSSAKFVPTVFICERLM